MARPKKSSNYKVIQDIDLSKNNIYNVNAIVGNSYDFEPNDLIITTYDTDEASPPANAGNLILRAGVADESLANSGSVHIFAGNEVKPDEGSTVLDKLASSVYSPLNGDKSRVQNGITVDPNDGVFIKSEISSEGKVSIEAKKNLSIESKNETTFNSPTVTKTVTTKEIDEVGTLIENFTTEHTETANKLNIYAGSYGDPTSYTLTVESNHGKNETDPGHSYINVDEIKVDSKISEGTDSAKVVRETHTNSDINTSELYELHAGNPTTLEIESNHKENETSTGNSYINVDELKVDKYVKEGTKTDKVVRTVFATTDTTDVSTSLSITAPAFSLNAKAEGSSLGVTKITSTDNDLKNLNLGKDNSGNFVVKNDKVNIDTDVLNINVPKTGGTVFKLSVDTTSSPSSSSMHIDEVNIDDTLLVGKDSTNKSKSAKIYTNEFVLDTSANTDTGLFIKGKHDLEITDHKEIPQTDTSPKAEESFINVTHIDVGTVDVDTDNAKDVIVSNSIKTTGSTVDVKLTSDSNDVLVNEENANKIRDVEINSTTINIKGGSKNNLHITSSLTGGEGGEVDRLDTKGLVEGDSFIETDDLRVNKNFYANQFYIYWDDSINSLVFANSEHTPKV